MLPYWILFLTFAVGSFFSGQQGLKPAGPHPGAGTLDHIRSNRLLIAAGFATAVMIGLRFRVGTDWDSYLEIFRIISRSDLPRALGRIDPGYALLNWLVAKAGLEIWVVNLVCGALFMFGLVRFARNQPNPWLAVAIAVPYFVIGVGMGFSRQAVAIGLSMLGLAALSRGSFNRAVFWVLAGALFHRTAVILIPVVALAYSRNRLQAAAVGLIGCVIGYYLLTSAQGLEHFQRTYLTRTYEAQGAGIRLAMNLPPALLYIPFFRRFTVDEAERRLWLYFAIVAALSFVAFFFVSSTAALDRLALYILPLQVFVICRTPLVFSRTNQQSGLLVMVVIIYSALVQFVWLNYSNNAMNWLPYRVYPFSV